MKEIVRPPGWYNMECPICHKRFHLKPCAIKKAKRHFCSRKCFYVAKVDDMKGENNHQYGLRGRDNPTWKSDKKISRYGYWMVRRLDHPFTGYQGWMFEHRLVAEKYLLTDENSVEIDGKRYLSREYDVHHKNFNRLDNRIENLLVLTKKEHERLHASLNKNTNRNEKGQFMKDNIVVKVKRTNEAACLPERKSVGAAGYDLCACISKPISIFPHQTINIPSGLAFQIPEGYFGAIYARSGIATRLGLRPATCVSVIDSDYRGEVGLPLHNDTELFQDIEPNERIAQIIFQKYGEARISVVDELDSTERGSNGFGSTGR